MIRSLRVSNFRSLGEGVEVRLDALTLLVGANGSGKSNVMDALRFVSDAMHMGLQGALTHRNGIGAVRRWSGGHPFDLSITVQVDLAGGTGGYSFELTGAKAEDYRVKREAAWLNVGGTSVLFRVENGTWADGPENLRPPLDAQSLALPLVGGDARFRPLVNELQNITVYSIFPDTLRAPQKYSPTKPMSRHGDNWVSVLHDQSAGTWKPELVSALHKLTGDIEDLRITQAAGFLVVEFRHHSANSKMKWFGASQESDGTLRVAGIVSALLQDPAVPVIGIEEPELTVHPGAVPLLHDFLQQASQRSQVIVTTHSPELLDLVLPSAVRVVERRDGETTIGPMAESQKRAVRDGLLTLGEALRTVGLQLEHPQLQ
jgi:predicted ATPase